MPSLRMSAGGPSASSPAALGPAEAQPAGKNAPRGSLRRLPRNGSASRSAGLGSSVASLPDGSPAGPGFASSALSLDRALDATGTAGSGLGVFESQRRKPFATRRLENSLSYDAAAAGLGAFSGIGPAFSSGTSTPTRSVASPFAGGPGSDAGGALPGAAMRHRAEHPYVEPPAALGSAPPPELAPTRPYLPLFSDTPVPPETAQRLDGEELQRAAQIRQRVRAAVIDDQMAVYDPDYHTPFADTADVLRRLLPYHIFQDWDDVRASVLPDASVIAAAEAVALQQCNALEARCRRVLERAQVSLGTHYMAASACHEAWCLQQCVTLEDDEVGALRSERDALIDAGELQPPESSKGSSPPPADEPPPMDVRPPLPLPQSLPPAPGAPARRLSASAQARLAHQLQRQQEHLQRYPPPFAPGTLKPGEAAMYSGAGAPEASSGSAGSAAAAAAAAASVCLPFDSGDTALSYGSAVRRALGLGSGDSVVLSAATDGSDGSVEDDGE